MIVNKPQFDVDKIKPGQAYWLTKLKSNGYKDIDTACLIKEVSPLSISVQYYHKDNYDENKDGFKFLNINVNDIATNKREKIELHPMTIMIARPE
jgi:hypothetical protein